MKGELVYLDGLVAKEHLAKYEIKHYTLFISPHTEGAFTPFFIDLKNVKLKEQINRKTIKIDFVDPSGAALLVRGEELIKELTFLQPEVFEMDEITKLSFAGFQKIAAVTVAFVAVVVALYLFVLPEFAESMVTFVTVDQEQYFGDVAYDNILQNFEVDTEKSEQLEAFANNIDFDTEYDLKYTVVHSPISNAFALPGGHIVVFDNLLNDIESEKELAALLSHEVSHIKHRHSLKAMFRSLAGFIFISLLLNDVNGLTTIIIDNANTFRSLAFSRSLEEEADISGLKILRNNALDQHGMVQLLEQISKHDDLDIEAVRFLSTHPVTTERIAYINNEINQNESTIIINHPLQAAWQKLKEKSKLDSEVESIIEEADSVEDESVEDDFEEDDYEEEE